MISEKQIIMSAEKTERFTNLHTVVYKNKKVIAEYNQFDFPKKYSDYYADKLDAVKQPVGVVYTNEDVYWTIMNVEEYKVVIGPCGETQPTRKQTDVIATMMGCNEEEKELLYKTSLAINHIPISTAVMMSCADYHMLTGIKLKPSDVLRNRNKGEDVFTLDEEKKWKSFCELDESMMIQERLYQFERKMCRAIRTGSEEEVERIASSTELILPPRANDQLRHYKNTFIIAATIASRAVIQCGVSPAESLSMADYYIHRCERADVTEPFPEMLLHMLKVFTRLVKNSHEIVQMSEFVKSVDAYIETHMSEKITVDQMAYDLGMSRNSLSGKFKQETGKVLSEYITMKKIDRAKYIIENSDNTFSEISAYLAFSSQSHFQRVFKKCAEMTPAEYKKKNEVRITNGS